MFACSSHKRTDVIKLLLNVQSEKIDVNAKNSNGENAFILACKDGNLKVVKILLNHHALTSTVKTIMEELRLF